MQAIARMVSLNHLRIGGGLGSTKLILMCLLAIAWKIALVSSANMGSSSSAEISGAMVVCHGGQQTKSYEDVNTYRNNEDETVDPLAEEQSEPSEEVEESSSSVYYNDTGQVESPESKRNARRKRFFDRIAAASSNLLSREEEAKLDDESDADSLAIDIHAITPQSDLRRPGRYIHIVTTAALPWMTGTAVNPLLRAAYLHEELEAINANTTNKPGKNSWVTLVIPWLELKEDQEKLFHGHVFNSTDEQEAYVREWLRKQAHMPNAAENLNIVFYNARYHAGLGSVFAMGDILDHLPSDELDVCILEEPEHLNWFRAPGEGWTKSYNFSVGLIHTNYFEYATQHYSGLWTAPAIRLMSSAMVRAYCHKVIKLSDVLQPFAPEREITRNVHGVRKEFIQTGRVDWKNESSSGDNVGEIYFIGKLLWAKGLNILLDYEDYYKQMTGSYFAVDIYGTGPDQEEIMRAYLGRWPQEERQNTIAKKRKNILVKAFTWLNRRPRRAKVSVEDVYRDLLEVLEALPTKARKSVSKVRGTVEQLYDDKPLSKESMGNLSVKLRKAINRLAGDISKVGFKLDSSSIPHSFYELRRQPIPVRFPGRIDHASLKNSHKIFVNPSVSEVLATTTYEALAMGKFAVIPVHPSNTFFQRFPNALMYSSPFEFLANLQWALTHDPVPLTEEMAREFTWEAATDRLISAAAITHEEARGRENLGRSRMDERIEWFHNELGKGAKGDMLRKVLGGGPVSDQVKYSQQRQEKEADMETSDDDEEDEEEGLSRKFSDSALVKAIRRATAITISA